MIAVKPFSYSRRFAAPRSLVWEVHTKPEHISQWFGPAGTEVKKFEMNFFEGGMNHYCIVVPVDVEMWGRQVYQEITPQERIVHIQSFSDAEGGISAHPMAPTWPKEMQATTSFSDDGDGTLVTVTWLPYKSDDEANATFDQARDSMGGGFGGMFDNLEKYIADVSGRDQHSYPSATTIKFTRTFNAPRELVWQAWSDEKHLAHWWGPEGFTITNHSRDFKTGGYWQFMMHGPDGTDYPNYIAYKAVEAPTHLAYEHGASQGDPKSFEVVTHFIDLGNKTRIETLMTFRTQEQRDITAQYGVPGHASTMSRLEKLLAALV